MDWQSNGGSHWRIYSYLTLAQCDEQTRRDQVGRRAGVSLVRVGTKPAIEIGIRGLAGGRANPPLFEHCSCTPAGIAGDWRAAFALNQGIGMCRQPNELAVLNRRFQATEPTQAIE